MSWKATAWAIRQTTGSSGRKVLLLALANYADEHGVCWPSQETLARNTEQSVDTVQRQLKKLLELRCSNASVCRSAEVSGRAIGTGCCCKRAVDQEQDTVLGQATCGLARPQHPARQAAELAA